MAAVLMRSEKFLGTGGFGDGFKMAFLVASKELLGIGGFGAVFKIFDRLSERYMVCKEVDLGVVKVKEHQKKLLKAKREVNAMKRLDHVHIVKYFGDEVKDGNQGPETKMLCIYMEFVTGGSVKDRLNKEGAFKETQAQRYTWQMLQGISYLHERRIIHRDLKCSNMLLDGNDNIKLADLGIAKECHYSTHKSNRTRNTAICGTMHYMAPEVMAGEKYGRKADIWSAGATVVEMLTTQPPWYKLTDFQVMFRIGIKETPAYVLDSSLSPEVRSFLNGIFNYDSERRPLAEELLKQDWLNDYGLTESVVEISGEPYISVKHVIPELPEQEKQLQLQQAQEQALQQEKKELELQQAQEQALQQEKLQQAQEQALQQAQEQALQQEKKRLELQQEQARKQAKKKRAQEQRMQEQRAQEQRAQEQLELLQLLELPQAQKHRVQERFGMRQAQKQLKQQLNQKQKQSKPKLPRK